VNDEALNSVVAVVVEEPQEDEVSSVDAVGCFW
jgi:hypothetical protein